MLMKAGIGWGYMPEPMIGDDVDNRPLVRAGQSGRAARTGGIMVIERLLTQV